MTGLANAMLKLCKPVEGVIGGLDIAGIGGDGDNTLNISIGSAILAAASGAKVAKVPECP
jgi:anthranilate phosphoribosyltransferase